MVTNIPRSQVRITVNCILNSSFHFNGLTIAIGRIKSTELEFRTGGRGGGIHVARLNFQTSRVGVYKCLSIIVGFAVTVAIWPREVVSCRDFILRAVATFWAMSLVGIYPGRVSIFLWMVTPEDIFDFHRLYIEEHDKQYHKKVKLSSFHLSGAPNEDIGYSSKPVNITLLNVF